MRYLNRTMTAAAVSALASAAQQTAIDMRDAMQGIQRGFGSVSPPHFSLNPADLPDLCKFAADLPALPWGERSYDTLFGLPIMLDPSMPRLTPKGPTS